MPQIQQVNLRRDDPDKPEPTGTEKFFAMLGKEYRERQDKAEIDKIISGYQQNRQDENALEDLFLNISKSDVGPTKRLQALEEIKQGQGVVAARDKALQKKVQAKTMDDSQKELVKEALRRDGWPEEEATLFVNSPPSVQSAHPLHMSYSLAPDFEIVL